MTVEIQTKFERVIPDIHEIIALHKYLSSMQFDDAIVAASSLLRRLVEMAHDIAGDPPTG